MMDSRVATLGAMTLVPLVLAGCAAVPGSTTASAAANSAAPTVAVASKPPMSLFPGCAAGGSVDLVGGAKAVAGFPTVTATVGEPVVIAFQVADDNGGHVKSASAAIWAPGTTLHSKATSDLAEADLALADVASGRSTLTFTPQAAGRYPIVVHSVQSVSDACAKRALAAGANSTDVVGNSIIGWVDAS